MIDKNMLDKEYSFTITNDNGIEVVCDTLALVEQAGEPIIIYTDYTLDDDNKFNLYISKVVEKENNYILEKIDNYENIPEIQKALENIWKKDYDQR